MWNERESPLRIEKRFEFEQYSKISKFMGKIDKLLSRGYLRKLRNSTWKQDSIMDLVLQKYLRKILNKSKKNISHNWK